MTLKSANKDCNFQFTQVIHGIPQTSLITAEDRLSGGNLMISFYVWGNVHNLITILKNFDNIFTQKKKDKRCLFP